MPGLLRASVSRSSRGAPSDVCSSGGAPSDVTVCSRMEPRRDPVPPAGLPPAGSQRGGERERAVARTSWVNLLLGNASR